MKKIIICIMLCLSLFSFTACSKTTGKYKYELVISHTEVTMELNENLVLTAVYGDNALTPSFSSSNKDVATVNGDGTITAVGEGYCYITASVDGEEKTCKVNVIVPEYVMEIEYEKTDYVFVGTNINFTAICYKNGAKYSNPLSWTVSPSNGCSYVVINSSTITFMATSVGEYKINVNNGKCSQTVVVTVVDVKSFA